MRDYQRKTSQWTIGKNFDATGASGPVLVMGTPSGVGQSRQPPLWLKPADRFDVDIERIGSLSNPELTEA